MNQANSQNLSLDSDSLIFDVRSHEMLISWSKEKHINHLIIQVFSDILFSKLISELSVQNNNVKISDLNSNQTYYLKFVSDNIEILRVSKKTLPMTNLLNPTNPGEGSIITLPYENSSAVVKTNKPNSYKSIVQHIKSNKVIEFPVGNTLDNKKITKYIESPKLSATDNTHYMALYAICSPLFIDEIEMKDLNIVHAFNLNVYYKSELLTHNLNMEYEMNFTPFGKYSFENTIFKLYSRGENNELLLVGDLERVEKSNKYKILIENNSEKYYESDFYVVIDTKPATLHGSLNFKNAFGEKYNLSNKVGNFILFDDNNTHKLQVIARTKLLNSTDMKRLHFKPRNLENMTFVKYLVFNFVALNEKVIFDMETLQVVSGSDADFLSYNLKPTKNIPVNFLNIGDVYNNESVLDKYYSNYRKIQLGSTLIFNGKSRNISVNYEGNQYSFVLSYDLNCCDVRSEISMNGIDSTTASGLLVANDPKFLS